MTRKSKTILVISAVFIAGVITGVCGGGFFAHKRFESMRKMGREQRRKFMMKRVFKTLDLSKDQERKVGALIDSIQQVTSTHKQERKAVYVAQKKLIEAEEFDEAAFRANLKKMANLKEDIEVRQALIKREINAVLNDDQKKLMDHYLNKLRSPRRPPRGNDDKKCPSESPEHP